MGEKNCNDEWVQLSSRESQEDLFFSLLFLFLLLRFSSTRLWKEGSCYYNTYDFFYWGELLFSFWGCFSFKAQRRRFSIICVEKTGFLVFWGGACERIAKNDILPYSSSLVFSWCYDMSLEALSRGRREQFVPFVRADFIEFPNIDTAPHVQRVLTYVSTRPRAAHATDPEQRNKQQISSAIWIMSASKGYLRRRRPAPDSSTSCTRVHTCVDSHVGLRSRDARARSEGGELYPLPEPSRPLPETAADEVTGERRRVLSLLLCVSWNCSFIPISTYTLCSLFYFSLIHTSLHHPPIHCFSSSSLGCGHFYSQPALLLTF